MRNKVPGEEEEGADKDGGEIQRGEIHITPHDVRVKLQKKKGPGQKKSFSPQQKKMMNKKGGEANSLCSVLKNNLSENFVVKGFCLGKKTRRGEEKTHAQERREERKARGEKGCGDRGGVGRLLRKN